MARMGRPGLSDSQISRVVEVMQQGQPLSEIGLALGKYAGSIAFSWLLARGLKVVPLLNRRGEVIQHDPLVLNCATDCPHLAPILALNGDPHLCLQRIELSTQ